MKNKHSKTNSFKESPIKYLIGFVTCLFLRTLTGKLPNVEPIMTTTMPYSKKWGAFAGFGFGLLSMIIFDLIHPTSGFARFGVWTVVTAAMYGLIGLAAGFYFKNKASTPKNYVKFSVVATLLYDFITGPIMSSSLFHMTFIASLIGQIPFTLLHLAGNIAGALILSPLLYKWVVDNKNLDASSVYNRVKNFVAN